LDNRLAFIPCTRHTVVVSRRTAICLLAGIISLVATQPVSGGSPRTGGSAAIVLLAQARTQKYIEREAGSRSARFPRQQHSTAFHAPLAIRSFFGELPARAPPVHSSAI
jgi:hypothetical protein